MYSWRGTVGLRDSVEVHKCNLEGWTKQPSGTAVRGFHSEETEEWYETTVVFK